MSLEWRRRAKCREFHPNAPWAPEGSAEEAAFIKDACTPCPVRSECLLWALEFNDPCILGGLNQTQRTLVRKEQARRLSFLSDRCGTDAGYFRHRRRIERACDACLTAHSAATAEKNRLRKRARRERLAVVERSAPEDTGACGTWAGYQRHMARLQEACDACKAMAREDDRGRRAARPSCAG